ncbi:MAG TPA: hypothetical protein VLB44_27305, partial [Kofleriaceae bacterium]|nr:hypothetical protein [Kofleriaceae bacterium]
MTLYLVFTARVEAYDRWRSAFDARSTVHRAAGMTLRSLARGVHDPSFVHVTFELASVEQAESFLAAPDTQAEAREGGVTHATYQ